MTNKRKILNISLTVLFSIALFFLIITFSIGLPIYCRFFYFWHVDGMNLSASTGYSVEEIHEAYNLVLNFLTLPNQEFSTGVFNHTPEGMAHFYDVKSLVTLNVVVMSISAVIIAVILALAKFKVVTLARPKGLFVGFYSAISVFIIIAILFIIITINPTSAFIMFHNVFFSGKDNWVFDPSYDEIIQILPEQFFINCAIFIGAGIIIFSLTIIILSILFKRKRTKLAKTPTPPDETEQENH